MAATEEVWLLREVHNYDRGSTCWNDGKCFCWRGSLEIVQCYKWGQERLCSGPRALLHLTVPNARRGFRALVAHSAEQMQKIVDAFSDAPKSFGLKIDITNTEVLYQPNSTSTREEDIIFDGKQLSSVLEFIYLGSIASSNGCIGDDIHMRMATFSVNLGRLRQRLWNNEHVPMRVKGKLYRAIELPTLLYGAEAWTVYRRQVKKLHAFMMLHLISIMLITWMDNVTNKEILEQTGLPYMEDLLIINNLGWIGHLMRLSPDRLQKQLELSCIELSCNILTQLK